jgi:drug/metabolite transporter (DMT)-like permease
VAVLLALAASVSWGLSDFVAGVRSRSLPVLAVLAVSMPAGLLAIGAVVAVRAEAPPDMATSLSAAGAGVAATVGIAALYRAMAVGAIAVVAPLSTTGAAIPVVVGLARGERPGALQYVGIALALAGVALAAREAEERAAPGRRVAAGVGLALVAAAGFGTFFVAIDSASGEDAAWATFWQRAAGTALVLAAVAYVRPRLPRAPAALAPLLLVGALDMTATGLFAAASTRGLVSLVSVLASLYPVTTVALAFAFLGERLARVQAAGVTLALGGVVLIAAG